MKIYLVEEGIVFGSKSFMPWDTFSVVLAELNGSIKGMDRARRNAIIFNQQQLSSELNANNLKELAELIDVKSEGRTANQLCSDIKKKLKRIVQ
jgi:hypothetical protein